MEINEGGTPMHTSDYLRILVEEIHSAVVATIGPDGHPQTRTIDMMLRDDRGVYFLTAKGKEFYKQLMEQQYIALSATKEKYAVSLRGKIRNIGSEKLDEIYERNPYMKGIYPENTRTALEVFCLYEAEGEYFDISDPSHIFRDQIYIGQDSHSQYGYWIEASCTGCGACLAACPQKCIDLSRTPAVIDQHHCLHCGRCVPVCPVKAVTKGSKNS